MEKRRLGKTELMTSIVTFGGASLGAVSQKEADKAIDLAIEHGVNHFDVAPAYEEAELRIGSWIQRHKECRSLITLGGKTTKRKKKEAREELHRSLERLQVDYFDLYQFHGVHARNELDTVTGPGGAVEGVLEAREKGLTRYIGISGHQLSTHIEALNRFDFDTIMFPLNFILYANPKYYRHYESFRKLAKEKDVGLLVIKTIAKRPWGDKIQSQSPTGQIYETGYEPFDEQEETDNCLRFVLSQDVTTAVTASDVRLVPKLLDAAERFKPLSDAEQKALTSTENLFFLVAPTIFGWY